MDHCHHQRSPLRPRHPHRLGPILTPLDPPFPFLPYPHILSPCAHRAEFPAVPCAPEAFSRTGSTSCARGGGPMVLGHFCLFFPYLLEASPVYNVLRYSFVKGMGIFRAFYPYLLDCTRPLLHSLSDFKSPPPTIKQVCRTPQRRFLYGTVSRVPRVQKEAGFLYRMYPQAARVQQKAPFLYRTENRLKVIEF